MRGRLVSNKSIVEDGQIIEPNIYSDLDFSRDHVLYVKRDFLYKGGRWRGNEVESGLRLANKLSARVLVVSHSDYQTSKIDAFRVKARTGVAHFFGTNLVPMRGFSSSLPLGLTSFEDSSEVHELFSNHGLLASSLEQANFPETFEGRIYANFNYKTNVGKRLPLLHMLEQLPYETVEETPVISVEGRSNYLRNLREATLVLCPEGNGVDTHRIWETLYMGGTPVVLHNKTMSDLLNPLPVIQLKSWDELRDRENIERLWIENQHKVWDVQLLTKAFWQRLIKDAAVA